MKEIYFDNSATTPVLPEVADAVYEMMVSQYGNPSALYHLGVEAERTLKICRKQIAATLAAEPERVLFTSGGTESDNLAILGVANAYKNRGKHMITTAIEHPAVLQPMQYLKELGWQVDCLAVDAKGQPDIEQLETLLRKDTVLVSMMLVNNEVGSILPVEKVAKLLKQQDHKIYFHVDAVQAYGKLKIKPAQWGVDLLSASAHKIHGPKGVGFLYTGKGVRLVPLLRGGGQENGLRSGTENMPGIVGLAKAAALAHRDLTARAEGVKQVRQAFLQALQEALPDWHVNGDGGVALPYVLNICFAGVKSEVLLHMLEQQGLYVSAGSACSAKKNNLSPVLTAMGLSKEEIEGSLRFSFSAENTRDEALTAAAIVAEAVKELRGILR